MRNIKEMFMKQHGKKSSNDRLHLPCSIDVYVVLVGYKTSLLPSARGLELGIVMARFRHHDYVEGVSNGLQASTAGSEVQIGRCVRVNSSIGCIADVKAEISASSPNLHRSKFGCVLSIP